MRSGDDRGGPGHLHAMECDSLPLGINYFFGGAQALGPALQSVGVTSYYYLFNASPFILTLAVIILTCSNKRSLSGVPGALADEHETKLRRS